MERVAMLHLQDSLRMECVAMLRWDTPGSLRHDWRQTGDTPPYGATTKGQPWSPTRGTGQAMLPLLR